MLLFTDLGHRATVNPSFFLFFFFVHFFPPRFQSHVLATIQYSTMWVKAAYIGGKGERGGQINGVAGGLY
eukprot:COSAG01_NODE_1003_length_12216_cov_8.565350_2_plen_70_part_00